MIGEDYNDNEEEKKLSKNKKLKSETDLTNKKTKRIKKTCTNCKELKLKIQELEQLNSKLVQTNKSLKQSNKETFQKLTESLKQNEILTKENEKLKRLIQELDQENNIQNLSKRSFSKKKLSKDESSDNYEEKEIEDKDKEENEIEDKGEEESGSRTLSDKGNKKNINYNVKKEKKIQKFDKKNLLTNEVILDILDRLSELEKFKIYMEATNQATDSKISYLESKIMNKSRKSSEDIGVPISMNYKSNKLLPPFISNSLYKNNEYNKNLNEALLLSKSAINEYNYASTSKKLKNDKNHFDKKFLSENYIKSSGPKNKLSPFKFNSKILNDTEDLDLIALGLVLGDLDKLKILKVGYKLIYRASNHGDKVNTFHKKCDNINGTLTVIKTKKGQIFGGYCSTCWESGDELIKEDLNSFVFSINLRKIYFVSKNNEESILCDKNKGPSFIGMFTINDNMFTQKSDINPWDIQRYSGESSLYEINDNEPSFYIEDMEVFQVLFR